MGEVQFLMFQKQYTIIYKSGTKVHVRAKSMTVKKYRDGHMEVEWDSMSPKSLLLGVDEIAAVFEGKV